MPKVISVQALAHITSSATLAEQYSVVCGNNYLVVDMRKSGAALAPKFLPACTIVGLGERANGQAAIDAVANDDAELAELAAAIDNQAEAAALLAQILRHNEHATIEQGLLAESLAYSTLQQSAGFNRWLANPDRPTTQTEHGPALLLERTGAELVLTFNRPDVHNAYDAALKDALCEGLQLPHTDDTIERVCLRGNGASFSAGGDLSEFGSVEDAAVAHLSRTTRGAAALLGTLPCASRALVHGACIGAGIELPAFTGHITTHPGAFFQLPEVAMGLIPGAGGTVSVPRRIGRQRTAYMALSNRRIDADTALRWGLVDALSDEPGFDHTA